MKRSKEAGFTSFNQLIDEIFQDININKKDIRYILVLYIKHIAAKLRKDGVLEIKNFVTFKLRKVNVNIDQGFFRVLKPKLTIKFEPLKKIFKKYINNDATLSETESFKKSLEEKFKQKIKK